MVDQAAIKALSLSVFERTFTVTTALNILTLAVAGFAMLMSLLTLAVMRLPQLAPVWALGLPRRHLAALDLVRAVVLAALTGALGYAATVDGPFDCNHAQRPSRDREARAGRDRAGGSHGRTLCSMD